MDDILTNTKFQKALEMLNTVKNEEIHEDKLNFSRMEAGKSFYFLRINDDLVIADVARDCFSPWSGVDRSGKKETANIIYRPVVNSDGNFSICRHDSDQRLKIIRNCHPTFDQFKREIFYVEQDKKPITAILFMYSSMHSFDVPLVKTQRILPSRSKTLKDALSFRTSRMAKNFLNEEGVDVTVAQLSSLSRSVDTHLKTKIGRKAPMNFHSIMDRYVDKKNREEHMATPIIETSESGRTTVRVMIGFPKAFQSFCMGLPTVQDVLDHRREVSKIYEMNEKEADRFCASFLESVNGSGAIPCLGSCVMLDTTFSLCSAELITVILGVSDVFKSAKSGKSASILLAYMIHTSKDIEQHEAFAMFINGLFEKYSENKRLNLLVHDGESSFRVYNTGTFMKDSIVIRCDVHRINNLKHCMDDLEDFELLKEQLYGTKKRLPEGSVLKKGILNTFSRALFDQKMSDLIENCCNEKARKWLDDNKEDLFMHNSMLKKLMAGWPAQFLSTNIIESKNSFLKTLITSKKPAQKVIDDFLIIHKEDMDERVKSVCGKQSKYISDFSIGISSWLAKTTYEKTAFLATFGLEDPSFLDDMGNIPSWALPSKVSRAEFVINLKNWITHRSDSDSNSFFVINHKNKNECVYVLFEQNHLKCFGYTCKKRTGAKFCAHSLSVYLKLNKEAQEDILVKMDTVRSKRTCTTILREQMRPYHGSKTRRIGKAYSHGNHSRSYAAIVDTTSTSIEDAF